MTTEPSQTAEQSEGDQHQTRWLGDGPERFAIEEIVHHDEVANRVADNTVGHDRIEARGKSNPADSLAAIGNSTQEAQPLVARDQSVSRENQQIVLVEELDPGLGCIFDVDEDRAEGAGGARDRRARHKETHIRDVAADRGKQPLRAEGLKVAGEAEQRGRGQAGVGADKEARSWRAEYDSAGRSDVEEVGRQWIRV